MTKVDITMIREALRDTTIASYPDFTQAVANALDELAALRDQSTRAGFAIHLDDAEIKILQRSLLGDASPAIITGVDWGRDVTNDPVGFRWRGIGEWLFSVKAPEGVPAQPLYTRREPASFRAVTPEMVTAFVDAYTAKTSEFFMSDKPARDLESSEFIRAGLEAACAIMAPPSEPAAEIIAATSPVAQALHGRDINFFLELANLAIGTKLYTAPQRIQAVVCIGETTIAELRQGKEVSLTNGIILIPASDLSDITPTDDKTHPRFLAGYTAGLKDGQTERADAEPVKPLLATRFKLAFDSKGRCTTFRKDQADELFGEWVWLIDASNGMNDPLYAAPAKEGRP